MASQDSKINSTNVGLYDYFGSSIGITNGYKAIVSAPNNDNIGNVYVYTNTTAVGGTWSQTTHILSSNVGIGDQYGYAVAICGGSNPHKYIVSAPSKADGRGAVYIYDANYSETEILGPSELSYFGDSVKLNDDGSKAIVGATGVGNAYILTSSSTYALASGTTLQQGSLSDYFGFSVDLSGSPSSSYSIVGAPGANNGTGKAYIYNGASLNATLPLNVSGALYPSELVEGDYFGNSVALDISGETAVIGAFLQNSQGAAHVFVRNTSNNVWSYQSKIVPNDIQIGDSFGDSVAISNDGNTIVVGASSKLSGGAMYTFIRSGTTWTQREKIVSSNLTTGDKFGYSVGISPNGRKAIAGAYAATSSSNIFSGGSAYAYSIPDNYYSGTNRIIHETVPETEPVNTFEKFNIYVNGQPIENTPTTWSASQTMIAPSTNLDGSSNIFFGNVEYTTGLSTLEPGSKLHVGNFTVLNRNAYDTWDNTALDFYNEGPPNQMLSVGGDAIIEHKLGIGTQTPDKPLHVLGEVRVSDPFPTGTVIDISSKSSILREVSKIKPVSQLPYETLGTSISITKDGKTAIIGAVRNPPGTETYGHVYVFDWKGDSWEQNSILRPSNIKNNDSFGTSSAISNDGKTIAIGAWKDNTVYIFTRSGDTWSQNSKITTTSSPGDRFGYAVDISEDGSTVVVGAPYKTYNNATNIGSVYVYMRTSALNSWSETHIIPNYTNTYWTGWGNAGDKFGSSVSITADGNTIVVGAPHAAIYQYSGTSSAYISNAGAVYIFKRGTGQSHPPTAMDGNTATNGYIASASSSTNTPSFDTWKAFNHTLGNEGWHGTGSMYDSVNGGAVPNQPASGYPSTEYMDENGVNQNPVLGEWIQLQVPMSMSINGINIAPRTGYTNRGPQWGLILGSNDGSTWTSIYSFSEQTYADGEYTNITFPASEFYAYFRIVVTKLNGNVDVVNISEIQLVSSEFGTDWTQQTWFPDVWIRKNSQDGIVTEFPWSGAANEKQGVLFSYGHGANGYSMGHASLGVGTGTSTGDRFGNSVDISDDGNTIIVGASHRTWALPTEYTDLDNLYGYWSDAWGQEQENHGTVYIFQFADGSWVEQSRLQVADYTAFDYFGYSVSLSSDGNTALIGSYNDDPYHIDSYGNKNIIENGGSTYIFTRTRDGIWSQKNKITPDVPVANGYYGASVCLSSNGHSALVTGLGSTVPIEFIICQGTYATYLSNGSLNTSGWYLTWDETDSLGVYKYFFHMQGGNGGWADSFRYNPNNKMWYLGSALFGGNVFGLSGNSAATSPDTYVYDPEKVYILFNSSGVWTIDAWFDNPYHGWSASTVYSYSLPDNFSNPYYNTLNAPSNLYVQDNLYIDKYVGINTNTPEKELHVKGDIRISDDSEHIDFIMDKKNVNEETFLTLPSEIAQKHDHFGQGVCISGDGYTVAIGSHQPNLGWGVWSVYRHPGQVHIYTRTGNKWTKDTTLQPENAPSTGVFGNALALTPDGNKLVVGAFLSGLVYVYSRSEEGIWSIDATLSGTNVSGTNRFGRGVSISDSGTLITVNSPSENSSKGALHTFRLIGTTWTWVRRTEPTNAASYDGSYWDMSGDGKTCVVTASGHDITTGGNEGSAWIYRNKLTTSSNGYQPDWVLESSITPTDIVSSDRYGVARGISQDGNTVAVSSEVHTHVDDTSTNKGVVYIWRRETTPAAPNSAPVITWVQEAKIFCPEGDGSDFGRSLSLSKDGKRIAIARKHMIGTNGQAVPGSTTAPDDAIYIFDRSIDGHWSLKTSFTDTHGGFSNHYGYYLSLTSSGDRLITSDPNKDVANLKETGIAFIYSIPTVDKTALTVTNTIKATNDLIVDENTGLGVNYPEEKLHVAGNIKISNSNDDVDISLLSRTTKIEHAIITDEGPVVNNKYFGNKVCLTSDGSLALTHERWKLVLYKRSGLIWSKYSEYDTWPVIPTNGELRNIALSGNGKTLAYATNFGNVHVLSSTTGVSWGEEIATNGDPIMEESTNSKFGENMVFSENGDKLLISASEHTITDAVEKTDGYMTGDAGLSFTSPVTNGGACFLYSRDPGWTRWKKEMKFLAGTYGGYFASPSGSLYLMQNATNFTNNDYYGDSIEMSSDGTKIFISRRKIGNTAENPQVECWCKMTSGTYSGYWKFFQYINLAPSTNSAYLGDPKFSLSVSDVNSSRRILAIGSANWTSGNGKVLVYDAKNGDEETYDQILSIDIGTWQAGFGHGVKLSKSGRILLVSAYDSSTNNTGNVYVYQKITNSSFPYTWESELNSSFTRNTNGFYGSSMSINKKGDRCIVGSQYISTVVDRIGYADIHNITITDDTLLHISSNVSINDKLSIGSFQHNRGQLTIYEGVGSSHHSHNQATLVLEHGDSGGSSCILFPSARNLNSDYGYIQYEDSTNSGDEKSRLIIGTQNDGPGGNQDLVLLKPTAAVGIGTDTPGAYLDVNGYTTVGSYSGSGRYFNYNTGLHLSSVGNVSGWGLSIRASNDISSGASIFSHGGTWNSSDSRIKTNINDVTDASALEKIRLLEPKTYKYIDTNEQGDTTVYGFIAQEVSNVFPEAVKIYSKAIPNIYELSNVSDSNVITFTNFNTSDLLTSNVTSKIEVKSVYNKTETLTLDTVIDAKSIRVKEDLTDIIGSIDDTGNVVSGNQVFVMGQEVDNFNTLKKEYIFTIATAALQEVDRQLQAEKTKVATLETQVADLLARVTALENN